MKNEIMGLINDYLSLVINKTELNEILFKKSISPYIDNRNFLKELMVQSQYLFKDLVKYISPDLQKNEDFIMSVLSSDCDNILYINEELKSNKIFIVNALNTVMNPESVKYLSESLKGDINIMTLAINKSGKVFKYSADSLKNNKDYVILAVKNSGENLEFASTTLKNDKEIVTLALESSGNNIQFASSNLRDDKEVVMQAMKKNGKAFQYISDRLKQDNDVCELAFNQDNFTIEFIKNDSWNLWEDDQRLIQTIKKHPNLLKFVREDKKNNKPLILEVLKYNGKLLRYVSDDLKKDKEVVLLAMLSYVKATKYMHIELKEEIGINNPLTYLKAAILKEKLEKTLDITNSYKKKTIKI